MGGIADDHHRSTAHPLAPTETGIGETAEDEEGDSMKSTVISRPGRYELTSDLVVRAPTSTGTIPAGTVIEVTQVDVRNRRVTGPELGGWITWYLPVRVRR